MNSENSIPLFEFSDQEISREPESTINAVSSLRIPNVPNPALCNIFARPPPQIDFKETVPAIPPAKSTAVWIPDMFVLEKNPSVTEPNQSFSVHEIFENINKKKPCVVAEQCESGTKREESSVINPDTKIRQCTELPIFDKITLPATLRIPSAKDKTPASSLSNSGKQSRRMKSIRDMSYTNSFFKHAGDNIGGFGGGFGGLEDSLFG